MLISLKRNTPAVSSEAWLLFISLRAFALLCLQNIHFYWSSLWCFTFWCLSASLFCSKMTVRYSSHCVWNSATCFLATSSSTVMPSTFSRVSLILRRPLQSLFTCSPSSKFFSPNSLKQGCKNKGQCTYVFLIFLINIDLWSTCGIHVKE